MSYPVIHGQFFSVSKVENINCLSTLISNKWKSKNSTNAVTLLKYCTNTLLGLTNNNLLQNEITEGDLATSPSVITCTGELVGHDGTHDVPHDLISTRATHQTKIRNLNIK